MTVNTDRRCKASANSIVACGMPTRYLGRKYRPALIIGQLALEHLDLVVDTRGRTLIGNPAHGGEHIYELY
jgi:hypothetical protein